MFRSPLRSSNNKEDFILEGYKYWIRPDLNEFLKFAFNHFDVAIWSASLRRNIIKILDILFNKEQISKIKFIFDQSHCDIFGNNRYNPKKPWFIKDIDTITEYFPEYNTSNIIFIDDEEFKIGWNNCKLIIIPSFNGEKEDDELLKLIQILQELLYQHQLHTNYGRKKKL